MEKFDVVVIGGGPGGYPAAIRAAQLGASVALIEKEQLGGTCLNWGCIPTKSLIASSELFHRIGHSQHMGITVSGAAADYGAMIARKNEVVGTLQGGVTQLLKANGVEVLKGVGSFESRNRLAVTRGKKRKLIEAGNTIIASGSTSAMPGFIPGGKRVVESRKFLDMTELPESMTVLGGGVIGCEFACMAAQLGVRVTVVEMLEDIVMVLDPDIRRVLRTRMEEGLSIRVLTGKPLEQIEAGPRGVSGRVGDETLESDLLLVSVGRRPVTDGLALDMAGVATDDGGAIPVDAYCQTRAATVYAIGDVVSGSTQLAHAATSQGITAAENACGQRTPAETVVPACIFTAPEVGSVGLGEQEAKQLGRKTRVGRFAFAALGKALALGETDGFIKWVADADTDQLLGAHAVGPHATELISEAAVAVRAELTVEELGRTIHCHPTMSESWMEGAHAAHGACVHAPPRRRK